MRRPSRKRPAPPTSEVRTPFPDVPKEQPGAACHARQYILVYQPAYLAGTTYIFIGRAGIYRLWLLHLYLYNMIIAGRIIGSTSQSRTINRGRMFRRI